MRLLAERFLYLFALSNFEQGTDDPNKLARLGTVGQDPHQITMVAVQGGHFAFNRSLTCKNSIRVLSQGRKVDCSCEVPERSAGIGRNKVEDIAHGRGEALDVELPVKKDCGDLGE